VVLGNDRSACNKGYITHDLFAVSSRADVDKIAER
jgi:hypothetical protein